MAIRGEKTASVSPVQKYLSRKGGNRTYWDKEKQDNFEFTFKEGIVLRVGFTIKGFDSVNKCGYRSNEIDSFKEQFVVFSGKNGKIAEGLYKDIKGDLLQAGAKLHIAITILHNGELVEFFLKGKAFYELSEFLKKIDQQQTKLKFKEAKEMDDAAQPYYLPVREEGGKITKNEGNKAGEFAQELIAYRDGLKGEHKEDVDDESISMYDIGEDLPF